MCPVHLLLFQCIFQAPVDDEQLVEEDDQRIWSMYFYVLYVVLYHDILSLVLLIIFLDMNQI